MCLALNLIIYKKDIRLNQCLLLDLFYGLRVYMIVNQSQQHANHKTNAKPNHRKTNVKPNREENVCAWLRQIPCIMGSAANALAAKIPYLVEWGRSIYLLTTWIFWVASIWSNTGSVTYSALSQWQWWRNVRGLSISLARDEAIPRGFAVIP